MIRLLPASGLRMLGSMRILTGLAVSVLLLPIAPFAAQSPTAPAQQFFIDCSAPSAGDGSLAAPWNSLADVHAHTFVAGDRIALARGSVCHGSFSPQGSGADGNMIRLTAYGQGPRPRIAATPKDRQALLLFNQQYWQIDSLDISGSSTYGVFVSGDKSTMHNIALKNLFVHDVYGGAMENKDNGLVVIGPSSRDAVFSNILIDGVVAAHTNQWAGILIGGGNFAYAPSAPLNDHITIRNSSVQDVYGDGIVLFRDSDGLIETSTAWQTGMQPTESVGTPNAIWTWTCTDCTVRDNEAFLTDSPGVDGGAYDIDWDNTRNTVERNYAHDTQGYCFAVFAAGYTTTDSVIRDNLCIDNGLSPRLAALQGAVYLHTWNDGVIRNLRMERNTFVWNSPVPEAAAIVDDAGAGGVPFTFTNNRIESASAFIYRTNDQFSPSQNTYILNGTGDAQFTLGDHRDISLANLQSNGIEHGSTLRHTPAPGPTSTSLRLDVTIDFALDSDGLLASGPRAQLMVLRSIAAQYGSALLDVTAHLRAERETPQQAAARANALLDLDAAPIHFVHDGKSPGVIRLLATNGNIIHEWRGFQNAATLGAAVRAQIGAPRYAAMQPSVHQHQ